MNIGAMSAEEMRLENQRILLRAEQDQLTKSWKDLEEKVKSLGGYVSNEHHEEIFALAKKWEATANSREQRINTLLKRIDELESTEAETEPVKGQFIPWIRFTHRQVEKPTTLLPCPFCNGKAELDYEYAFVFFGPRDWRAQCTFCGIRQAWRGEPGYAIAAWNARPTQSQKESS